jgi:hypothetical protein
MKMKLIYKWENLTECNLLQESKSSEIKQYYKRKGFKYVNKCNDWLTDI